MAGHHRIKLNTNWRGQIDGEDVYVKEGSQVDVDLDTARALVFERKIASWVPIEEVKTNPAKKKPGRPKGSKNKPKSVDKAPADKMVTGANDK